MNLRYIGSRTRAFGIVGEETQIRYTVTPGQDFEVADVDGPVILRSFPDLFEQVQPAASEGRRKGKAHEPAVVYAGDDAVGAGDVTGAGPEMGAVQVGSEE